MTATDDTESFQCLEVPAAAMDRLWAEGWRHFGVIFFRYTLSWHEERLYHVMPLRIELSRFAPSRSQRRVNHANRGTRVIIRPSFIDATKEALFDKHRRRFDENMPSSLHEFLSPVPDCMPCPNVELCVYGGSELWGVTFLDLGLTSTSAVYAIFDPLHEKRSLGIYMMLQSIEYSFAQGRRYYYPGYAYREPFRYDYKKRFGGLEYLDWEKGWIPYPGSGEAQGSAAK